MLFDIQFCVLQLNQVNCIKCFLCVFFLFSFLKSRKKDERDFLRKRAWQQRIQETTQPQDFYAEPMPLFGEPFKVKVHVLNDYYI